LAFDVVGSEREAFTLLDHLQIIKLAVSLGGTETPDLPPIINDAFRSSKRVA
jgi:cystathionine beta-lyase/cystathionine gamma-synthase